MPTSLPTLDQERASLETAPRGESTTREFASLAIVRSGVSGYRRFVHVHRAGGSPVDFLLSSPSLVVAGAGWLSTVLWSVHMP